MSAKQDGATEYVDSPAKAKLRAALCRDYRRFYKEIVARDHIEPGLNRRQADCWGEIHDLAVDFALLGIPDVVTYSELPKYKIAFGDERWLYWRQLSKAPEVHDGPDNPIAKMYYERPWQGVVVRLKGDGKKRSTRLFRGGLKSTLLTKGLALWFMVRNPANRNLLRCIHEPLGRTFNGDIRYHFEENETFRELFCNLERGRPWTQDALQLLSLDQRHGSDNTFLNAGMETDLTGKHPDTVLLDDVITEFNSKNPDLVENATRTVRNMFALANAGTTIRDVGTTWADNDPHTLFDDPDVDSSFFVATLIDGNPNGKCITCGMIDPQTKLPMPGNPMWPEGFSVARVETMFHDLRRDPFIWRSQYFNQLHGTVQRLFDRAWIEQRAIIKPAAFAKKETLNIYAGLRVDAGRYADGGQAAGIILGQTPDNLRYYLLDAFKEPLAPDEIARGIYAFCAKWSGLANAYGGTFYCGIEKSSWDDFLKPILEAEQRKHDADGYFFVEGIDYDKQSIRDRIRVLQFPYRLGLMKWPDMLLRETMAKEGANYDACEELKREYVKYPGIYHHELLNAHAAAFALTQLPHFREGVEAQREQEQERRHMESIAKRDKLIEQRSSEQFEPSLGGFERLEEWEAV